VWAGDSPTNFPLWTGGASIRLASQGRMEGAGPSARFSELGRRFATGLLPASGGLAGFT